MRVYLKRRMNSICLTFLFLYNTLLSFLKMNHNPIWNLNILGTSL
jgi:hypothetical protein